MSDRADDKAMTNETTSGPTTDTPAKRESRARSHTTKKTPGHRQTRQPKKATHYPKQAGATRALPGWAIDLITDGVPPRELWASGNSAVVGALISTAMSAQHRHWSIMDWEAVVLDPKRALVTQLRRSSGRPETPARIREKLHYAWDRAWANRTTNPAWDADALAREIAERYERAEAMINDQDNSLSDPDRLVLHYAAKQMVSRGITRVALPWREVMKATKLPERTTKNALTRLPAHGALHLAQRGAAGGPRSKRRLANIYEVAPNKSRGTRPVGQPAAKVGPRPAARNGTPSDVARPAPVVTPSPASTTVAAGGDPGFRITQHPDGRLIIESTAISEGALVATLTTLASCLSGSTPAP